MKITLTLLCLLLSQVFCAASSATSAFVGTTREVVAVKILRTKYRDKALLEDTKDQKKIGMIIELFDFIDPTPRVTKDGKMVIMAPCFCLPDYVFEFTLHDGHMFRLYLPSDFKSVTTDDGDFGLLKVEYATDVQLSDKSTKELVAHITRLETEANKALVPTAINTPSSATHLAP